MLGIYNYTVILTYLGMLVSFAGITFSVKGDVQTALICLMISGICDMFDGKVASTKDRTASEKRFGIQIDSLSDLVCFGVFPAVIVYTVSGSSFSIFTAGLYLLCALIRLAWFNVDEEERQEKTNASREVYLGLPVTTSALIIPAVFGVWRMQNWPLEKLGPIILFIMAIAFIIPFKLKKPALPGKIGMLFCGCAELFVLFWGMNL